MKKILQSTLFLLTLAFSGNVIAQDVLLEELFNDETLGVFTEYSEVGDDQTWRASDFGGKFFAQMNGFSGGAQNNVDWLISPALDMGLYNDEVLRFENAANFGGPRLELYVSNDYTGEGDPNAATWLDLTDSVNWSTGNYEYVESGAIDLSGIEGTGYFAFKYTSSEDDGAQLFQIDSVTVTASVINNIFTEEVADKVSKPYVSNDNLVFNVLSGNVEVSIASMNGSVVSQYNNKVVSGDVALPLNDLPRGTYALVVTSEGTVKSYKFFK